MRAPVQQVVTEVGERIVGQETMVERLLIGLLTGGHILLEGVPGLAKTLAVKTLAEIIEASFSRIQFTPDLLPADLIGTMVFDPKSQEFRVKQGPIFAQIILADEINRAPAKVQAALLEAMQEHQVTIGGTSFALEEPFLVLATQNPIENEGTYPLPEAQLDRFMLKVRVGYPDAGPGKGSAAPAQRTGRGTGAPAAGPGHDPRRSGRRSPRPTWTRRWWITSWIWCAPPAIRRWSGSAESQAAGGLRCVAPGLDRAGPGRQGPRLPARAGAMSSPRTSGRWRPTCCATGCC